MKYLFLAALAFVARPALAAQWEMQPSPASTLGFNGVQTGAPFTGTFKQWTAQITYDPAHPEAAHVHVTINTGSAYTDDTQRDEALPGADWFNVASFPQAVFDATGFISQGGDKYTTTGTLAIRGVAKKITLKFTLDMTGDQAVAKGQIDLMRVDFGVGQGAWTSGDWVALSVGVNFVLTAKSAHG